MTEGGHALNIHAQAENFFFYYHYLSAFRLLRLYMFVKHTLYVLNPPSFPVKWELTANTNYLCKAFIGDSSKVLQQIQSVDKPSFKADSSKIQVQQE